MKSEEEKMMDRLRLLHEETSWKSVSILFACSAVVGALMSPFGVLGGIQSIVFLFAILQAGVVATCFWFHFTWKVLPHMVGSMGFLFLWFMLEWYRKGSPSAIEGGIHYGTIFVGMWIFAWIFSVDLMFPTEEE